MKFLRSRGGGAVRRDHQLGGGRLKPLPFEKMIDPETKRMRPREVDVDGEGYECARRYMIRLEPRDFEDPEHARTGWRRSSR